MFLYLIIYFLSDSLYNLLSIGQVISTELDIIIFFFLISEIFNILTIYSLILLLEFFEKNIQFSRTQTIMTMLIFTLIGLILSNPDVNINITGDIYVDSFYYDSLIIYLEMIFYLIAGFWIIIILYRSKIAAKSPKQKKLIINVILGVFFANYIPFLFILYEFSELESIFILLTTIIFISQNLGIIFIGFAFLQIRKYPWLMQKQKVFLLLIYNQHRINLFHKIYSKEINLGDSSLLAGGFTAVTSLIQEATKSESKVKSILLEEKELKIINREDFTCALIVEYSTQASELAHMNFTIDFEKKFLKELKDFDGEVSIFESSEEIALKYFS